MSGVLLPCPFCGAAGSVTSDPEPWPGAGRYNFKAGCAACDVWVAAESVDGENEAIAAWDTRAPAFVSVAEVEAFCAAVFGDDWKYWQTTEFVQFYLDKTRIGLVAALGVRG